MAPSTKKETTEGARQEPQIPENSYPFSQKFTPQPQTDTSSASSDDSSQSPDTVENLPAESAKPADSQNTAPEVSPESSPAPSSQTTLPPVAPQSAVSVENQELSDMDSLKDPANAQATPISDNTAIPMPASFPPNEASENDFQASANIDKKTDESSFPQGADSVTPTSSTQEDKRASSLTERGMAEGKSESAIKPSQPPLETSTYAQAEGQTTATNATGEPDELDKTDETGEKAVAQDDTPQDNGDKELNDNKAKSPLGRKGKKKTSSGQNASSNDSSAQQKSSLSFAVSHPILPVPPSMPGGLSNALFNSCSYAPWLFLTLLFVLQTLFTLDVRALWYSDEVRHAAVFTSMLQEGNLFKLELNGQLYPDKPSLYFWFLRGLYEIFHEEGPRLYFGAAAISGLLFLWSSLLLGRLVGRFDGRSLFAGGILLLCGSYFMGVTHYARMDLLFSSFIICSYIAFFLAFTKPRAPLLMALACIFGALACLTKGPLGLALPLSALVLFAIWRGKITRFFSLDFIIGLVIAALIVGGWLAGLAHETSLAYIQEQVLGKQVLERAVDAFHHKAKWSYYLERLPILLMPWVAIILCLPFHRLFTKKSFSTIAASRTSEREGQAFLWYIVLSALMLLSAISTKIIIYLLPALPAMCLLAGRAVLQLSGKRATAFKFLLGLTLLLGGVALFIATLKIFGSFPLPNVIDSLIPAWEIPTSAGFFISTGILCATALFLLLGLPSSRPEGVLLTLALMATALAYPLFGMAAPSLDAILSPKAQGQIFKEYIAEGYHPLTYDMYDGIYTYYAESIIDEVYSIEDITAVLEKHPHVIVAIQQRALNKLPAMPECFEPIHKQMIEQHEYVLLACPPLEKEKTASDEAMDEAIDETPPVAPSEADSKTDSKVDSGVASDLNESSNGDEPSIGDESSSITPKVIPDEAPKASAGIAPDATHAPSATSSGDSAGDTSDSKGEAIGDSAGNSSDDATATSSGDATATSSGDSLQQTSDAVPQARPEQGSKSEPPSDSGPDSDALSRSTDKPVPLEEKTTDAGNGPNPTSKTSSPDANTSLDSKDSKDSKDFTEPKNSKTSKGNTPAPKGPEGTHNNKASTET